MIKLLLAVLVPTRWLRRLAIITRPPGTAVDDPLITDVPDTWLPPYWIHPDRLGDAHPNKQPHGLYDDLTIRDKAQSRAQSRIIGGMP